MPTLIFAVLILVAALWVLGVVSKVDPKIGARVLKAGGGIVALGLAVFLGLRGEIWIAIPLGGFGLGLLGWLPFGPAGFSARTQKTSGRISQVRSAYFEMELDHDSGQMRGRIIAGRHQGAALERDPSWSEHAQGDAAAGRAATSGGKMSEQEAYQILGVEAGASAGDIRRAHRSLMKKFHPDQGGSTYLAARINEAKEVLMRSHR